MSTKTSIKRIALVAVSALGFGLLSVVPAKAAAVEAATTGIASINLTKATASVDSVGGTVAVNVGANIDAATKDGTDTNNLKFTLKGSITTFPTGGNVNVTGVDAANGVTQLTVTGANATARFASANSAGWAYANDTNATDETKTSTGTAGLVSFTFVPTVTGTHVLTVWHDQDGQNDIDAGEASQTISITVGLTVNRAAAQDDFGATASVRFGTVAPVRVGAAFRVPVVVTPGADITTNGTYLDASLAVSGGVQPAASAITCADSEAGTYSAGQCTSIGLELKAASADATADNNIIPTTKVAGATAATDTYTAYYWVKVDTAGTYNLTASLTDSAGTPVTISTASVLGIVTAGAPTTITITPLRTSVASDTALGANDEFGTSVLVSLKDSTGAATVLSATESLSVSITGPTGAAVDDTSLTSGDFNDNKFGYASFTAEATGAGTATITVSGTGSPASTVSATSNITFVAPDLDDHASDSLAVDALYTGTTALNSATGASTATAKTTTTAVTVDFTSNGGTANKDKIMGYVLNDVDGVAYDIPGLYTSGTITLDADGKNLDWSVPFFGALGLRSSGGSTPIAAQRFSFEISGSGTAAAAGPFPVFTAAAVASNNTNSSWNVTTVNAIKGAEISATLTLKDQFGTVISGEAVTFTIAGRNAAITTGLAATTDSNGRATLTYTDAGTVGTDSLGVTTTTGSVSKTVSVTYNTNDAVDKVTAEGPNTDQVVPTAQDINASSRTGAQNGIISTVKATVVNAAGAPLQGVAVTWAVDKDGAAVRSDYVTTYTDATGVATTRVYAWLAGTYSFTATAGTKTSSTSVLFAQVSGQAEARTISAAVSGTIVTATVKDRYGNPIASQDVYATRTGSGYFANGAGSTSAKTDKNGVVEFVVTPGSDATVVTVALGSTSAADTTWGQSDAIKGNLDGALAASVLGAYTAGTAVKAETGVGVTYDAAGINSATATVAAAGPSAAQTAAEAATDAAAEAIDAANAATDAANLAAEAADAATVAAEEARDAADAATAAVEELATQVATLMAALKAQITTLANTVAKIAKKVKA